MLRLVRAACCNPVANRGQAREPSRVAIVQASSRPAAAVSTPPEHIPPGVKIDPLGKICGRYRFMPAYVNAPQLPFAERSGAAIEHPSYKSGVMRMKPTRKRSANAVSYLERCNPRPFARIKGVSAPTEFLEQDHAAAPRPLSPHPVRSPRQDLLLLLIAPPSATDHARHFRVASNDLRVVTNVDHNVRTISLCRSNQRWSRLSEQFFRVDKWSVCRG